MKNNRNHTPGAYFYLQKRLWGRKYGVAKRLEELLARPE